MNLRSRRDFFVAASFGPIAAHLAWGADPSIHVGVTDWNLRLGANPEAVPLAAKIGFDGVQVSFGRKLVDDKLPVDNPATVARYLALSTEHKITIAGTCVDRLHENGLKSDKLAVRWVQDSIRLTSSLKTRVLLLPFFGKWAIQTKEEMDYTADALRDLGPEAEKAGVILGLEDTISAEDNVRIMERSRSKAVLVYYDVGNSTQQRLRRGQRDPLAGQGPHLPDPPERQSELHGRGQDPIPRGRPSDPGHRLLRVYGSRDRYASRQQCGGRHEEEPGIYSRSDGLSEPARFSFQRRHGTLLADGVGGVHRGAQQRPDVDPGPVTRAESAPSEPHMRQVNLDTDILVAGGGLAGVCAAISAARHGARVVLVQDRSRLGGNSSSEVKMHVVGANCHTGRPGWRESGLIEELRLADAVNNPQRCWELWDLLLYDKVVSEPNITLLLETTLYSATVRDGRIVEAAGALRQERASLPHHGENLLRLYRRFAARPGSGRRHAHGPRGAVGVQRSRSRPRSRTTARSGRASCLRRGCIAIRCRSRAPKWARKITKEQLVHRKITSWEYGYWWIEWGGDRDIIADNEKIRFELLAIVMGVWDYIKNSGDFPDSRYWGMDWVGMMPGKRGSRRLLGDHVLTQQDLMKGELPGCGRDRRLADGCASAGGLRPFRPAAQYGAAAARSLRHPAALAVQPQCREPVHGRAATSARATWLSRRRV